MFNLIGYFKTCFIFFKPDTEFSNQIGKIKTMFRFLKPGDKFSNLMRNFQTKKGRIVGVFCSLLHVSVGKNRQNTPDISDFAKNVLNFIDFFSLKLGSIFSYRTAVKTNFLILLLPLSSQRTHRTTKRSF
jgi:hypothetical protein